MRPVNGVGDGATARSRSGASFCILTDFIPAAFGMEYEGMGSRSAPGQSGDDSPTVQRRSASESRYSGNQAENPALCFPGKSALFLVSAFGDDVFLEVGGEGNEL